MSLVTSVYLQAGSALAIICCMVACAATGYAEEPATPEPIQFEKRIIAVGDVHGDYKQFVSLLRNAGLIDKKNTWVGGDAHLVQMGDIPDRGPDTRMAMDFLIKLQKQAQKNGGEVTVLIGNHEAMMMIGDLRFVHPGEYAAFKGSKSKKLRNAYYQQTIAYLEMTLPPEELPTFDKAYRDQWEQRFPLGYVEHRLAWAPTGEYGKWVLSRPAVAKVGDTLFVHGGISPSYAGTTISEINTRVRTALAEGGQIAENSIVEDENGPLWYRGWVLSPQNAETTAVLDQILADFQVSRMVVAHTPLTPIIVPRFDGKILMADVGLSAHYGGGAAILEITGDDITMLVGENRLAVPNSSSDFDAYFDAAEKLVASPQKISRYRETVKQAQLDAQKAADKPDVQAQPNP